MHKSLIPLRNRINFVGIKLPTGCVFIDFHKKTDCNIDFGGAPQFPLHKVQFLNRERVVEAWSSQIEHTVYFFRAQSQRGSVCTKKTLFCCCIIDIFKESIHIKIGCLVHWWTCKCFLLSFLDVFRLRCNSKLPGMLLVNWANLCKEVFQLNISFRDEPYFLGSLSDAAPTRKLFKATEWR